MKFILILALGLSVTAAAQSNYATPYYFSTFAGPAGGPGDADGTGGAARFRSPSSVALDAAGNAYVTDTENSTIRKITPAGVVTTFAGSAGNIDSLDGTGTAARFDHPEGIASDATGNLYVADTGNNTIRKITPAGIVTTVAGSAIYDPRPQTLIDGTGSAARFSSPSGIAVDAAGIIYVADTDNHSIRKITSGGAVTTFAGSGSSFDYGSTDGTGSAARFTFPRGAATDAAGNVYITDTSTIRKITPAGVVTTLAGSANRIAADAAGNLYVTGSSTIRKITASGIVTTIAGSDGIYGFADGTGSAARFDLPLGLVVDATGNVFVADSVHDTIRKVTPAGVVTTLAGSAYGAGATDSTGTAARFYNPKGVAVDGAGNVYVADLYNCTIRKITASGAVTTLAGLAGINGTTGSGGSFGDAGSADGTGSVARFAGPAGIAVDAAGMVYVADTNNNTIRKITPAGAVTTLAGDASAPPFPVGPSSVLTPFYDPTSVAVDSTGNVYVADYGNSRIAKVTPDGVVTTLAGSAGNPGWADGTGTAAQFHGPQAIAVDRAGNVYVAERVNYTIRKITPGGVVTTLAGSAGEPGSVDATGSAARFELPGGIAADATGNVYVSDQNGSVMRKITPAGVVTTLGGIAGLSAYNDGTGSTARFYDASGVAVDQAGNLYVASGYNQNIRKGQLAGMPVINTQPQSLTVASGGSVQLSVTAGGLPDPTYQWYFNGSPFSGATSNTLSFTNARSTDAGDYTVIVTNSLGSVTSNKATLTVGSAPTPAPTPTPTGGGGAISGWFVLALLALGTGRFYLPIARTD